jgi:energy-coupling factor transporter ATP-binding protein EcfA2
MQRIKILSLNFGSNKFRKLSNISIPISPRITVIAGHNGIGKSTILALLAHPSGLTNRPVKGVPLNYAISDNISYFEKTFQANFNEILHIDPQKDYLDKIGPPKILSEPEVLYSINEIENLVKACRIGPRPGPNSTSSDARMVARTVKPTTAVFSSADGSITVGPAGKVPLPTIYLGMTRVLPIGEAEPGTASSAATSMHADDAELVASFINGVISGNKASAAKITSQRIKNTGKVSGQPMHGFDARCVSLGQDSLGSIAFALASFQKLARVWPHYPGGLLIIDEIDAGLHPHAIGKLVAQLKTLAKRLRLQIVATTHSPKLIEAVHPESEPLNYSPQDGVIYIRDTNIPSVIPSPTLKQILNDMDLVPPAPVPKPKPQKVKIYFEDDEAAAVFRAIVPQADLKNIGRRHKVSLDPMPIGVGCESLASLADHDPYFKKVIMVLDGDSGANCALPKNDHIVKLPGDRYMGVRKSSDNKDIVNRPLSPERCLLQYLKMLIENPDNHTQTISSLAARDITTNMISEHILDGETTVLSKRDQLKGWWKSKLTLIKDWELLEEWARDRPAEVATFQKEFDLAVSRVVARKKS